MSTKSAKQKILETASVLFYNDGINNTGINSIIENANVAKMSLYNNFKTKSELVTYYIEARHQEWLDLYEKRKATIQSPIEGVLAVFDAYQDHAEFAYENGFRGCGLLNAAAEFPAHSPERLAVKKHKDEVESIVAHHLSQFIANDEKVKQLSLLLSFLLEGSIVLAGLESSSTKVFAARQMAQTLLEQEISN
ncbi:TetR/AcrR family transcriptional regulator [Acinetobacter haemolyticus]|uniref:TetR/AcrR family transcriptional regulator n=1 Tax=Acinetobacter haemolyticus TaxID=29430 RepID=UPI000300F0C3|nr:TetR/AcrR family transcriptional regulator [Acinetobacter haemolyticus]NAR50207.1 TetR family transcriptional regulator [Acinetobacter haemolyticus]NAR52937.1 TetR family transcriptional regulator [Acinetobacter haemolyticus]NAR60265.1 TetR family transcriptional regulator [Acinetobacter haemolyticus]NAR67047.1 TetR family transcriptional regulator [Acinetobacter haemolyticus]NAR70222.1 TetR family transcriptional regulator [Acinetobacter haemolyticus]